jgi:class 3 adenylate cyclase/sensor domain CHASE-containing protein
MPEGMAEKSRRGRRWIRTLRGRTLVLIAGTVLGLLLVLHVPMRFVFMGSILKLEEREARQHLERARQALVDDLTRLTEIARDYAIWDETFAYLATRDPVYVSTNYVPATLADNRLSFVAIADLEGRMVFSTAYDPEKAAVAAPPGELGASAGPLHRFVLAGREKPMQGVLLLSDGPYALSAQPVHRSNGDAPSAGTLLMGRALNLPATKALSESTRLALKLLPATSTLLEASSLSGLDPFALDRLDDDRLVGRALVSDPWGAPALVIDAALNREIYAQGRQSALFLTLSLLLVGLVFAVVMTLLLGRVVLTRLGEFSRKVDEIAGSGDLSSRVPVSGDDELTLLSTDVNRMLESLQRLHGELTEEREKSERLLLNVLPKRIAERLKTDTGTIADSFGEVSVLFADLVDFTRLSESISPAMLVALLNEVFTMFDSLAERHGLEKIKTIGDAYMVVSGLPEPRPDHAEALALMALDMREAIEQLNETHGLDCRIRIGLHCGPVVAGVIGRRKFIYDLWGDTVNTASRMESHGIPGEIQVTATMRALLHERYELESRGVIPVKGKGDMETFLLRRRRAA